MEEKIHLPHESVTRSEHNEALKRIGATEKLVASLAASVESLRQTVHDAYSDQKENFEKLNNRFDTVANRVSAAGAVNWQFVVAAIGLSFALVGGMAGFIVLHTAPISERSQENSELLMERLKQLPDDYYQFGRNSAVMEHNHDLIIGLRGRMEYQEKQVSEMKGKMEVERELYQSKIMSLERWIRDVDVGGGRIWNKVPSPAE